MNSRHSVRNSKSIATTTNATKKRYGSCSWTVQTCCLAAFPSFRSNFDFELSPKVDYRYKSQIKDLKDRLEQATATNKSMQNYVNFLKNSYSTVFNDNFISTSAAMLPSNTFQLNTNHDFSGFNSTSAVKMSDNFYI